MRILEFLFLRYQDLHSAATGKTAAEDTDPTHIIRFLGMMTNSEIARKITQKGIPEGMTLGQVFTRAIELEVGYQLSEGVSLARPPEIMQVQEIEEIDEIAALPRRLKDVACWGCGEKGHLHRDCPHRHENMHDDEFDDSNEYAGKSEQVIRITQPIRWPQGIIFIKIRLLKELGLIFIKQVIEEPKWPYKSNRKSMQPCQQLWLHRTRQ